MNRGTRPASKSRRANTLAICLCGAGSEPANQSHNAHRFAQSEIVTVYYRWHPLYGRSLPVRSRQKVPCCELVFVQMESGATCGLPAWMLSAACATFVLGPPLIATGALLELRALLGALPSDLKCGKASLKRLPPKEGRKESSAEVSVRTTQPFPAASRPGRAAGRQGPPTGRSPDRTAAQRRRTSRGERRKP